MNVQITDLREHAVFDVMVKDYLASPHDTSILGYMADYVEDLGDNRQRLLRVLQALHTFAEAAADWTFPTLTRYRATGYAALMNNTRWPKQVCFEFRSAPLTTLWHALALRWTPLTVRNVRDRVRDNLRYQCRDGPARFLSSLYTPQAMQLVAFVELLHCGVLGSLRHCFSQLNVLRRAVNDSGFRVEAWAGNESNSPIPSGESPFQYLLNGHTRLETLIRLTDAFCWVVARTRYSTPISGRLRGWYDFLACRIVEQVNRDIEE